ncbi:MAG: aminopeptidase N [Gammaproteobacteria bacterium]
MPSAKPAPSTVYLKDYKVPPFLIERVTLKFELSPSETIVTSDLVFSRNPESSEPDAKLKLDGDELKLLEISLGGMVLSSESYTVSDTQLELLDAPDNGVLRIVTQVNPEENKALAGLYRSSGMYCTQCEADGFRRITYFPDRPDVMSRYQVTVVGDAKENPVMLSNGNCIAFGTNKDGRHWVTWDDPFPKPSYLFALVAGDLHCNTSGFTTQSGRDVELRIYVEHENADKTDHAMQSLKRSMRWDEERFGLEYDLDLFMIVAVNDFNMGAMENKGLNVFNSKYVLASPASATDQDYEFIESIVAHEYFHNWTGNRVTCRDWFQLSLKEGLTVYRDQEFSGDMGSRGVKRIADVRTLRSRQFREDAGPTAHPIRPDSYIETNNLYTATVYEKGAEVIRMMANLLGRDGFRRGMDLYFERHDGQAVTCDDFVAAMADANNADLKLFKRWYTQAGTPVLRVESQLDDGILTLSLSQNTAPTAGQELKKPLHIPVRIALLDLNGDPLSLVVDGEAKGDETVLELTQAQKTWKFSGMPAHVIPSVLRGFSAPVELSHDLSRTDKLMLLAKDSDGFSRWNASESLAYDEVSQLLAAREDNQPLQINRDYVDACRDLLEQVSDGSETDFALVAELLSTPTEADVVGRLTEVDIDAVAEAVQALNTQLSEGLYDIALNVFTHLQPVDAVSRRLRNHCLRMVCRGGDPAISDGYVVEQIADSKIMTDVLGALSPAVTYGLPSAAAELAAFREKWKGSQVVLTKWFALQASVPHADTVDVVRELTKDSLFAEQNPNLVSSLFSTLSQNNPVAFHREDGTGYTLLADEVLRTNDFNPQLAVRLVSGFNNWKKVVGPRRQLMKDELNRISAAGGLSRGVFDIVNRALS